MKPRSLFPVFLSLCWTTAVAQTGYLGTRDPIEPKVEWDYVLFGPPPGGPFHLEVYYRLFNNGLTFHKDGEEYKAEYEVEVIVYQDGEQVTGTSFRETYAVENFPRTLSATDFLLNEINLKLDKPGSYDLVLRLRDVGTDHAAESSHKLEVSSNRDEWCFSQPEFARQIQAANDDTSQFNKADLIVVPSVTRSYGGESQPECPLYIELYGPENSAGKVLRLKFKAKEAQGTKGSDTTISVTSRGRITPVVAALPVSHLMPGPYNVSITLLPEKGNSVLWQSDDWFDILWSMSTLLRTDFPTAVEQLRYIASETERNALLKTPDSLRTSAWQAFWDKRDPTPGSENNEYRDEFYRRLRYCNANFSVGDRAGWRTDRGMIYVQLGEPDEVETHPMDMDGYPYNAPWQVWRYYQNNLEFVFVDSKGSGDYELQYPYDGEYWRRN